MVMTLGNESYRIVCIVFIAKYWINIFATQNYILALNIVVWKISIETTNILAQYVVYICE